VGRNGKKCKWGGQSSGEDGGGGSGGTLGGGDDRRDPREKIGAHVQKGAVLESVVRGLC